MIHLCKGTKRSVWSRDVEVFCTRRGQGVVSNCKQNTLKPRSRLVRRRHSFSAERTTEQTQTNWNSGTAGGALDCWAFSLKTASIHPNTVAPMYGKTPLQLPSSLCFSRRSSAASASTTHVVRAAIAVALVTTSRPGWREPSTPGTSARVSDAHAKRHNGTHQSGLVNVERVCVCVWQGLFRFFICHTSYAEFSIFVFQLTGSYKFKCQRDVLLAIKNHYLAILLQLIIYILCEVMCPTGY